MIVFEYFYERMEIFAPLMEKKAEKELRENYVQIEEHSLDGEEVSYTVYSSDNDLLKNAVRAVLIPFLFSIGSTGCSSTTDTTSF